MAVGGFEGLDDGFAGDGDGECEENEAQSGVENDPDSGGEGGRDDIWGEVQWREEKGEKWDGPPKPTEVMVLMGRRSAQSCRTGREDATIS